MSIQAWAHATRQSQNCQQGQNQHTINILESVFEGATDPDSAASQINSIYESLLEENHTNSPVNGLWGIICEAVRTLGANTTVDKRLVNFLNALAKLPDVTDKHGHPVTGGNGVDGVYWRDLPNLAIIFREYAMDVDPGVLELPDNEGDWTDAQRTVLLNVTTFGALYLARGLRSIGMDLHAEDSLMDGLEEPYDTPEQRRRAATVVPPASTWILLAGEAIYEFCKKEHKRREGLGQYGRGYSLGRWVVWKEKFGLIGALGNLEQSVRRIAQKAASEMNRVDGGPQ